MEIRYTLTAEDYQALQYALHRHLQQLMYPTQWFGFTYYALLWVPAGMAAAALFDNIQRERMPSDLMYWLIASLIFYLTVRFIGRSLMRSRALRAIARSRDPLFREQRLALSPEGVRLESEDSSALYTWRAFANVQEDGERLFLFLGDTRAIVVPKCALSEGVDRAYFRDEIKASGSQPLEATRTHSRSD